MTTDHKPVAAPGHGAPPAHKPARSAIRSGPNVSAIIGMVSGVGLLAIAVGATAADPLSFLNLPSAILVIGGTLAATLITYSFGDLGRAAAQFFSLLRREHVVDRP